MDNGQWVELACLPSPSWWYASKLQEKHTSPTLNNILYLIEDCVSSLLQDNANGTMLVRETGAKWHPGLDGTLAVVTCTRGIATAPRPVHMHIDMKRIPY